VLIGTKWEEGLVKDLKAARSDLMIVTVQAKGS